MGKRKWNVLHSRLKVLTKLEIKALKKENQSWLSSLKTIPLDDTSTVADAIMKAMADKRGIVCRRRAAWLYCWLLTERLPDVLWTLLATEDENENDNKDGNKDGNVDKVNYKNGGVRNEKAAFEECAVKMTTSKQSVNVQCVVNNGAIYACMLVKGGTSGPNGVKKIYLVMSRNRKLLAAKRVGGPLQNNLNHALTEAFPKFRIKPDFLESEDIDRVLLEGVHSKKRIARELKESGARGSATEQSVENSVEEDSADDSADEDSADEDGARKGGAHKDGADGDGTDEEPADEDYTSKEDASDSSLQYSSLEDSLRVEPVIKESSPDTMQEVVKPGPSNNRKQSRRARATKKPGPTPVAIKDSQPGSSRDSKPWTEHDDQPAGSAENKVDTTAARRKRVSTRSPVPKLEHRPKKGVPNEKPKDSPIKEPDEVDPKVVYQDALKEVEGLESIINKLNSGKIYIGRSHENEVRKLCLALHEFCCRKARNPDVRNRMLDAVRHELSISCPLFVWEEVEFSAPAEQALQDTGKKTPKKQSERKKKTKQGTSAKKSSAYAKLKKLWSEINKSSESDKNRMRELLEETYEERRAVPPSTLPEFFLDEYILSMEAEIRFGSDISALEEKLRKVAVVLSTALNRDFTMRAVCEYLDEGTSPSLITEGLVPVDNRDNSPRIYTMNGRLWIYTGSSGKTVEVASGRMERALVLCLVLYYIKYIDYPEAFWRVLYVLQFVLIPSDPPPPVPTRKNVPVCQVTYKMRGLLDLLTSKVDKRGPDAK